MQSITLKRTTIIYLRSYMHLVTLQQQQTSRASLHTCHFNVMNIFFRLHPKPWNFFWKEHNFALCTCSFSIIIAQNMIHKRVDWLNTWETIIHKRALCGWGYTHMTSRFFAVIITHEWNMKMIAKWNFAERSKNELNLNECSTEILKIF